MEAAPLSTRFGAEQPGSWVHTGWAASFQTGKCWCQLRLGWAPTAALLGAAGRREHTACAAAPALSNLHHSSVWVMLNVGRSSFAATKVRAGRTSVVTLMEHAGFDARLGTGSKAAAGAHYGEQRGSLNHCVAVPAMGHCIGTHQSQTQCSGA